MDRLMPKELKERRIQEWDNFMKKYENIYTNNSDENDSDFNLNDLNVLAKKEECNVNVTCNQEDVSESDSVSTINYILQCKEKSKKIKKNNILSKRSVIKKFRPSKRLSLIKKDSNKNVQVTREKSNKVPWSNKTNINPSSSSESRLIPEKTTSETANAKISKVKSHKVSESRNINIIPSRSSGLASKNIISETSNVQNSKETSVKTSESNKLKIITSSCSESSLVAEKIISKTSNAKISTEKSWEVPESNKISTKPSSSSETGLVPKKIVSNSSNVKISNYKSPERSKINIIPSISSGLSLVPEKNVLKTSTVKIFKEKSTGVPELNKINTSSSKTGLVPRKVILETLDTNVKIPEDKSLKAPEPSKINILDSSSSEPGVISEKIVSKSSNVKISEEKSQKVPKSSKTNISSSNISKTGLVFEKVAWETLNNVQTSPKKSQQVSESRKINIVPSSSSELGLVPTKTILETSDNGAIFKEKLQEAPLSSKINIITSSSSESRLVPAKTILKASSNREISKGKLREDSEASKINVIPSGTAESTPVSKSILKQPQNYIISSEDENYFEEDRKHENKTKTLINPQSNKKGRPSKEKIANNTPSSKNHIEKKIVRSKKPKLRNPKHKTLILSSDDEIPLQEIVDQSSLNIKNQETKILKHATLIVNSEDEISPENVQNKISPLKETVKRCMMEKNSTHLNQRLINQKTPKEIQNETKNSKKRKKNIFKNQISLSTRQNETISTGDSDFEISFVQKSNRKKFKGFNNNEKTKTNSLENKILNILNTEAKEFIATKNKSTENHSEVESIVSKKKLIGPKIDSDRLKIGHSTNVTTPTIVSLNFPENVVLKDAESIMKIDSNKSNIGIAKVNTRRFSSIFSKIVTTEDTGSSDDEIFIVKKSIYSKKSKISSDRSTEKNKDLSEIISDGDLKSNGDYAIKKRKSRDDIGEKHNCQNQTSIKNDDKTLDKRLPENNSREIVPSLEKSKNTSKSFGSKILLDGSTEEDIFHFKKEFYSKNKTSPKKNLVKQQTDNSEEISLKKTENSQEKNPQISKTDLSKSKNAEENSDSTSEVKYVLKNVSFKKNQSLEVSLKEDKTEPVKQPWENTRSKSISKENQILPEKNISNHQNSSGDEIVFTFKKPSYKNRKPNTHKSKLDISLQTQTEPLIQPVNRSSKISTKSTEKIRNYKTNIVNPKIIDSPKNTQVTFQRPQNRIRISQKLFDDNVDINQNQKKSKVSTECIQTVDDSHEVKNSPKKSQNKIRISPKLFGNNIESSQKINFSNRKPKVSTETTQTEDKYLEMKNSPKKSENKIGFSQKILKDKTKNNIKNQFEDFSDNIFDSPPRKSNSKSLSVENLSKEGNDEKIKDISEVFIENNSKKSVQEKDTLFKNGDNSKTENSSPGSEKSIIQEISHSKLKSSVKKLHLKSNHREPKIVENSAFQAKKKKLPKADNVPQKLLDKKPVLRTRKRPDYKDIGSSQEYFDKKHDNEIQKGTADYKNSCSSQECFDKKRNLRIQKRLDYKENKVIRMSQEEYENWKKELNKSLQKSKDRSILKSKDSNVNDAAEEEDVMLKFGNRTPRRKHVNEITDGMLTRSASKYKVGRAIIGTPPRNGGNTVICSTPLTQSKMLRKDIFDVSAIHF